MKRESHPALENFKNPQVEIIPDKEYILRTPDDTEFVCYYKIQDNADGTFVIQTSSGVYNEFNRRSYQSFAKTTTTNRIAIENILYSKLNL